MVSVSQEALTLVKTALTNFRTDIVGVTKRSDSKAEDIMTECQIQIRHTEKIITELEKKIEQLTKLIEYLEEEIEKSTNEVKRINDRITQLQHEVQQLSGQIAGLQSQISLLKAKRADCEDDDMCQQLQSQIHLLENEKHQAEADRESLENEIRRVEDTKYALQRKISDDRVKKAQFESEFSILKNKCNKYINKFERQKSAYKRVDSDLKSYVDAIKKFETSTSGVAQKNISAVDSCILSIDRYMEVSI